MSEQLNRQRRFYDERPHEHLQPRDEDVYTRKIVRQLVDRIGLEPGHRVLEVGAGFGRFTFELTRYCDSVVALDLSARALGVLEQERDERGISASRCSVHCGDVNETSRTDLGEFDRVVGFFILHHLDDHARAIESLAGLLSPGGQMAFVEPNRRNPLFLAQVACCRDMSWREERGMFQLSRRGVNAAYAGAGLEVKPPSSFGFFPPQILNRFAWALKLETRFEDMRLLRPVLPFLLLGAHNGAAEPKPSPGATTR